MKIGKTNANSTAGEPVSSPASFRRSRLTFAKNVPKDRIVVRPQPRFEANSAREGLTPALSPTGNFDEDASRSRARTAKNTVFGR